MRAEQEAQVIPVIARSTSWTSSVWWSAVWVISAPHEARDGGAGLGDLGRRGVVGLARGVDDAVRDVLLEQAEAHGLEGAGHRAHLGEDVDAVGVVVDHPRDAAHLALDAAQPLEMVPL